MARAKLHGSPSSRTQHHFPAPTSKSFSPSHTGTLRTYVVVMCGQSHNSARQPPPWPAQQPQPTSTAYICNIPSKRRTPPQATSFAQPNRPTAATPSQPPYVQVRRSACAFRSVPEVAHARGEQYDAVLVAAVDGVLVAHGAAGVHNGRHARLARNLHAVIPGEGEEGVRGQHRALRIERRGQGEDSDTVSL